MKIVYPSVPDYSVVILADSPVGDRYHSLRRNMSRLNWKIEDASSLQEASVRMQRDFVAVIVSEQICPEGVCQSPSRFVVLSRSSNDRLGPNPSASTITI